MPRSLRELQQAFLDLRFGMFVHFSMATFQDREWGDPTSEPDLFTPSALDTDQWARAAKSAGMTWGCLTTKHHDGFCLWPTETRSASVAQTRHRTDVVRAYVDSFRNAGLKVGLYYSILDLRENIRRFNITADKIQLVKDQLTELFTNYGPIDVLIIDGWDAPWSRISYEEVPFAEIYHMLKGLQPECLISDLNASQYPEAGLYYTDLKAFEQNAGQHLPAESHVPAYSCVTLTDGWFWKQADMDAELKPTDQVVNEWLIPQNERHCSLILNAPPTREGRLAPNVLTRLEEIGRAWRHTGPTAPIRANTVITTRNLATGRASTASSSPDTVGPDQANDGDFGSTWRPEEGETDSWIAVHLGEPKDFNTLVFVEPVGRWSDYASSRIAAYRFEVRDEQGWRTMAAGSTSQPVQIHEIETARAIEVRLSFLSSGPAPHIAEIGVYNEPR